ncbi:MAG: iron ABC transporter permease [Bacteroidetes bacterium]|nr:iron ABC transporter permease [Bacteroidota bacterium]
MPLITPPRRLPVGLIGSILLPVLFLFSLMAGTVSIPAAEVLNILVGKETSDPVWQNIILDLRLPKALTAALCGAGLAVGGVLTQSLFRNPLNGPDVIGLTSGAGLGVALMVSTGIAGSGALSLTSSAFAGSSLTFLLISRIARSFSANSLLIAGIMFSAFASSIITVLQFYSGAEELQRYTLWTMGNISSTTWEDIPWLAGSVFAGIFLALYSSKGLDAYDLSTGYAESLGIQTSRLRRSVLISAALLTGSITAFCGPITFVGIAGPHLVRVLSGGNTHIRLIPYSALAGSILVLTCDLLSSLPGPGRFLPLNAVTALLGAPVVIWIIYRSYQKP